MLVAIFEAIRTGDAEFHVYMLCFLVMWFVIQSLCRVVSPLLYAPYTSFDEQNRTEWDLRTLSTVHAILVVPFSILAINDPVYECSKLFGYSSTSIVVMAFSASYFVHDVVSCVLHFQQIGGMFLLHGLLCCVSYAWGTGHHFFVYYGLCFLAWEASTPFVNFRSFLVQTGQRNSILYTVNGLLLIAIFIGIRLIWGSYMVYVFFTDIGTHFGNPFTGGATDASVYTVSKSASERCGLSKDFTAVHSSVHWVRYYVFQVVCLYTFNIIWSAKLVSGALRFFSKANKEN